MMKQAIPITVFTGFLGAGKTSVILSLLPQLPKDYKVVLLKNEFGDVAGTPSRLTIDKSSFNQRSCLIQSIANLQNNQVSPQSVRFSMDVCKSDDYRRLKAYGSLCLPAKVLCPSWTDADSTFRN